jgi:hypothetical protein
MLQRGIGNQTTLRPLAQRGFSPNRKEAGGYHRQEAAEPENTNALGTTPGVSWDFSKIPIFPPDRASRSQSSSPLSGVIQPKLAVGAVDDPLEREADRVAEQVIRGSVMVGSPGHAPTKVSRRCAACEDEAEKLHPKLASVLPAPRLPGFIQAKLKVGDVDDPLEREADRVAEQVMRMPAPSVSIAAGSRQIGRKCADCEQEEKLQTKPVRPQAAAGEAPASVYEVLRSPGQSLDAPTRAYFESRFGHDFSRVRVHTGTTAEGSAQEVNANAYTVGHNIAFGSGRFAPETHEGRQLLAHELTHVVQQSGGEIPHLIRRQGPQAPGCPALNVTIGQGQCGANYGATATYCFTGGFANNTQVWFRENVAELLGAEVKCQPGAIGQAPAPGQSRTRDNCFRDQIINSNGPPSKVAPCWDGTYQTLSVGPTQNSVGQCAYTQNQIIEVTTTRKDGRGNPIAGEVITNAGQEKTKCNWP